MKLMLTPEFIQVKPVPDSSILCLPFHPAECFTRSREPLAVLKEHFDYYRKTHGVVQTEQKVFIIDEAAWFLSSEFRRKKERSS